MVPDSKSDRQGKGYDAMPYPPMQVVCVTYRGSQLDMNLSEASACVLSFFLSFFLSATSEVSVRKSLLYSALLYSRAYMAKKYSELSAKR